MPIFRGRNAAASLKLGDLVVGRRSVSVIFRGRNAAASLKLVSVGSDFLDEQRIVRSRRGLIEAPCSRSAQPSPPSAAPPRIYSFRTLARRSARADFCSADRVRFPRKGFVPMRKGQLGHVTAVHLRTSPHHNNSLSIALEGP
jgi:hypothetical protein